jgi:uncharacterized protein (TIGR02145 family)
VEISVVNLAGQVIVERQFSLEAGKHSVLLPVLASGVYLACIRSQTAAVRVVKWLSTGEGTQTANIRLGGNADVDLPQTASVVVPKKGLQSKPRGVIRLLPPEKQVLSMNKSANGIIQPLLYTVSEEENIVEMLYTEGDLLRFTGKNGNKTTIVMNIPTCSHDITFDFYGCTDAGGRHYAVVNAGDMLWMAEDLSGCPAGIAKAASAGEWNSAAPTMAYLNYSDANADKGGYYNHAAAKIALPTGWHLPTAGEVDAMLTELGGYDTPEKKLAVAELLKSREEWNGITALDSISFGAKAAGIILLDGNFDEQNTSVSYWTRSTKNLVPIFWQLNETDGITFSSTNTADTKYGYRVRGCRPAPSAYKDIMDPIMTAAGYNTQQKSAAPAVSSLFESGPLGGTYRYMLPEPQNLAINLRPNEGYLGREFYYYNTGVRGSYRIGDNNSDVPYSVNWQVDERGVAVNYASQPSKMAALRIEKMDDDRSLPNNNLTMKLKFYNGNNLERSIDLPQNLFSVLSTIYIYGTAPVTENGFERYKPYALSVPTHTPNSRWIYWNPYEHYPGTVSTPDNNKEKYDFFFREVYSRHIQLLAADFTGDCNDELVFVCNYKVYVLNAETGAIIQEKTFPAAVRADVGDADGDLNPDITVAYLNGTDATAQTQIEIYHNGDLTVAPVAVATAPISVLTDIKTGNLFGNGKNQLIVYTRKAIADLYQGDGRSANDIYFATFDSVAQVSVYEYDADSLPLVKSFEIEQPKLGNNTLCLVDFSGANGKKDLAAGNKIYRYNTLNDNFSVEHEFLSADDYIPVDNLKAGYINSANSLGFELVYNKIFLTGDGSLGNPFTWRVTAHTFGRYNGVFSTNKISQGAGGGNNDAVAPSVDYLNGFKGLPYMALLNTNYAKKILEYRSHATTMSEPRIYALLAAPPFFKYDRDGNEYQYGNFGSMGTSWGKSEVVGSSTSNSSSSSNSFIVGFEFQYEAPVIGVPLGGIDFEMSMESEVTHSTEKSYTTTQSIEFTTSQQDVVILSAAFYDTYTYEIVESENPDEIGGLLTISIPDAAGIRTMGLSLKDYERMMADNRHAPNLRQIFQHKEGFPFTYPNEALNGLAAMPFSGQEFVSTGSAASVNRSISLDESTAQTAGMSFSMDMELVVTGPGGVKAGAGFGTSTTSSSTHSEGNGHSIAGNVLAPNSVFDNVPQFRWNVYWLKANAGGQEFPVVYYVVKE